ncbi:hypothetical protein KY362_06750 [Candidatus Woesearchaeota archaeon]|nr:hypothetical protein [Candidatus Woesearchaeota archaeon]
MVEDENPIRRVRIPGLLMAATVAACIGSAASTCAHSRYSSLDHAVETSPAQESRESVTHEVYHARDAGLDLTSRYIAEQGREYR